MNVFFIARRIVKKLTLISCGWLFSLNVQAIIYQYDNLGRLISADYGAYGKLTYIYDAAGNILSSTTQNSSQIDTDNDGIPNIQDPDDDNDGMPDTWELAYGLDPLKAADGALDKDNDGVSNLAEYQAGRNPELNEAAAVSRAMMTSPRISNYASFQEPGKMLLNILPTIARPK